MKKEPPNMVKLNKIVSDLCYRGCLDLLKIHFNVPGEVIASTRNRLTEAVQEVMNNFVVVVKDAEDREQAFLDCFNRFYWKPFESIMNSFIRKEKLEEKEKAFIKGEFENEKNRALEDAIAVFK